jgi:HK97 family phage prohead protease
MKTKDFALQVKSTDDDGTFTGYASMFGNVDSYGEICTQGCFAKSLSKHQRDNTKPLLLWQHDPEKPIGVWDTLSEDDNGLIGTGRLLKGVRQAEEALILLRAGALRGLSIGYHEVKAEPDGATRKLVELDLIEASIVSFPANRKATITAVKSDHFALLRTRLLAGDPPTDREWEKGMRDAFNLSNSEAERAVRLCLKVTAQGEPGKHETEFGTHEAIAVLRDAIKGFSPLYPRT